MNNATKAGAKEISPAKDYEYGYRQGEIERPVWTSLADTKESFISA